MKYWLLKGICTAAHKAAALEAGVKIIDAKFSNRFHKDSIFEPEKELLESIDKTNGALNIAAAEVSKPEKKTKKTGK